MNSDLTAIDKLINIAQEEVGYLEKKNLLMLQQKTSNPGYNNYTKYWEDIKPEWQGEPWCACFVTWCFKQAFGEVATKQLLRHYPFLYCPTIANLFELHTTPTRGDIVIFKRNGDFVHTGIVVSVKGNRFSTIEGNTSGGSAVIANGGGVCGKSYCTEDLQGTRFITVDWSIVEKKNSGYEVFLEALINRNFITDRSSWSDFNADLSVGLCVALFDKMTGGCWPSEEANPSIHWAHPHIISLCGKGYIKEKEQWIKDIEGCPSKAMVLAMVAKHINNGTKELAQYECVSNDHWGRNYLNYLCDKNIVKSPSVWCDDFESTVCIGNFLALMCKSFKIVS